MQNDVSLDDLISKDREGRKKNREERTKPPRTKRIEKPHRRERERRYHEDREERHDDREERSRVEDRFHDRPRRDKHEFRGYTLLVKGFVADVSTEDIFVLCLQCRNC